MRGYDERQSTMLTLVNPEQRVPTNHPIRLIKALAEVALKELSPLFAGMYSEVGGPSIPPERLLKASLLMALYTVRSEPMFCEQLDYNLLFRWFLDLNWTSRVSTTRPSAAIGRAYWSTTLLASFPHRCGGGARAKADQLLATARKTQRAPSGERLSKECLAECLETKHQADDGCAGAASEVVRHFGIGLASEVPI